MKDRTHLKNSKFFFLQTFLWHCQIQPFSENYERLANNLWVKKLSKGKPDAGKYKGKRLRSNSAVEDGSLSSQLSFFVDILRFCHLFRIISISHVSQCCHLSIIISHKAARVWWKCFHLLPLWSLPRSVKSSIACASSFVWRIAYGSNQEWIIKDLNVSSFHDLTLGWKFSEHVHHNFHGISSLSVSSLRYASWRYFSSFSFPQCWGHSKVRLLISAAKPPWNTRTSLRSSKVQHYRSRRHKH